LKEIKEIPIFRRHLRAKSSSAAILSVDQGFLKSPTSTFAIAECGCANRRLLQPHSPSECDTESTAADRIAPLLLRRSPKDKSTGRAVARLRRYHNGARRRRAALLKTIVLPPALLCTKYCENSVLRKKAAIDRNCDHFFSMSRTREQYNAGFWEGIEWNRSMAR
jgi:hypothetical protein